LDRPPAASQAGFALPRGGIWRHGFYVLAASFGVSDGLVRLLSNKADVKGTVAKLHFALSTAY